ncbi:2-dehydro-3-deoxygluconokinase [Spirosomataceae bacterium TFI 002]|nr:2-dehydro-3-deoxygluconokinase [Spirosomataceae bacterium TFI 002]
MRVVTIGEVMMRLVAPNHKRFIQAESFDITYGGGEANVGASLAQFGVDVSHVTVFPDNDLGDAATIFYKKFGVDVSNIIRRGKRLGTYFLEFGASVRPSKIIYDREFSAFSLADPAWFDWDKILAGADFLQWTGITPALSENCLQITKDALATAKKNGVTVLADVNYRSNLWNYGKTAQEVMPELISQCDIITCSEKDAFEIFGLQDFSNPAYDQESFIDAVQQMMNLFPNLKKIVTTRRNSISASTNELKGIGFDGEKYVETEFLMIDNIVDRIGGGDAFLAGIIYGELQNWDLHKTLSFANAASVLKHTIYGDVNICTVAEIEEIMAGNTSGRIKR